MLRKQPGDNSPTFCQAATFQLLDLSRSVHASNSKFIDLPRGRQGSCGEELSQTTRRCGGDDRKQKQTHTEFIQLKHTRPRMSQVSERAPGSSQDKDLDRDEVQDRDQDSAQNRDQDRDQNRHQNRTTPYLPGNETRRSPGSRKGCRIPRALTSESHPAPHHLTLIRQFVL